MEQETRTGQRQASTSGPGEDKAAEETGKVIRVGRNHVSANALLSFCTDLS